MCSFAYACGCVNVLMKPIRALHFFNRLLGGFDPVTQSVLNKHSERHKLEGDISTWLVPVSLDIHIVSREGHRLYVICTQHGCYLYSQTVW